VQFASLDDLQRVLTLLAPGVVQRNPLVRDEDEN
jgi:hypothetical protein